MMLSMQRSQPKGSQESRKACTGGGNRNTRTLGQAQGGGFPLKALTTRWPPTHGHLQEEKLEARSCNLTQRGEVGTWQIQVSTAPRELV